MDETTTMNQITTIGQDKNHDIMNTAIITFDVGGQIYPVSKDLLQSFPNTMLSMAATDITTNNHDNPIFIERNGYRFQYVLDYKHDGNKMLNFLPGSIRKELLFMDLEYFGFVDYKEEIPHEMKNLHGIQYHRIVWDTTKAASGLVFGNDNLIVTLTDLTQYRWQSGRGLEGFTTGLHFWSLEIMAAADKCILVGVSDILRSAAMGYLSGVGIDGNGSLWMNGLLSSRIFVRLLPKGI
jgi:BTB/POZ domain